MSSDTESAVVEPAVRERQWPVTVTLKYPVQFGSESIGALTFRRGRLADIKGLKVDVVPAVDQIMLVASRMCVQPIKVIEMLDAEDASEVIELVLTFFAQCLGDGKTS
jgi:hypothetical protein